MLEQEEQYEFNPKFKYDDTDEEEQILPEILHPLIKDVETERKFKDLHVKAFKYDKITPEYDQVSKNYEAIHGNYKQVHQMIQEQNFDALLRYMELHENPAFLNYMVKRVTDESSFRQLPKEEQERQSRYKKLETENDQYKKREESEALNYIYNQARSSSYQNMIDYYKEFKSEDDFLKEILVLAGKAEKYAEGERRSITPRQCIDLAFQVLEQETSQKKNKIFEKYGIRQDESGNKIVDTKKLDQDLPTQGLQATGGSQVRQPVTSYKDILKMKEEYKTKGMYQ
ncbi:MAG: hypothetical protein HQK50_09315 [Oligoflexia bacterium]|nr:hypothetical protein [Oligoflexia bacterium]